MFSPRTQALAQGGPGGTPDEMFRNGFGNLALQRLEMQFPDLAQSMVTFEILGAEPSTDSAVGVAILDLNGSSVHLPIILAQNDLQPMDMLYLEEAERFIPLQPEWIQAIRAISASEMGQSKEAPETLPTDKDIRSLVIPPSTGRYAYAAAGQGKKLPAFLREASNRIKEAFTKLLKDNTKIASWIIDHYDLGEIKEAVRFHPEKLEKQATVKNPVFVSIETPSQEVRSIFGDDSPEVMRNMASGRGYAAKEMRPFDSLNAAVEVDRELKLMYPEMIGVYEIITQNNQRRKALVFPKVHTIDNPSFSIHEKALLPDNDGLNDTPKVLLFENGDVVVTNKPFVGELIQVDELSGPLKEYLHAPRARSPRNNQRGMFLCTHGHRGDVTYPFKINRVTRDRATGSLTMEVEDYSYNTFKIIQKKGAALSTPRFYSDSEGPGHVRDVSVPWHMRTERERKQRGDRLCFNSKGTLYLPDSYVFVPCETFLEPSVLANSVTEILDNYQRSLLEKGASQVKIATDGVCFYVDGKDMGSMRKAHEKIASDLNLHVDDVETILLAVQEKTAQDYILLSPEVREKIAQPVPPGAAAPQGPPPQGPGGPPQGPGGPPMPNPLQIAAQEIMQQVAMEQQSIQSQLMTQQQAAQEKMMLLQQLAYRSQEIAAQMGMGPPPQGPPPGAAPQGPPPQGPPPGPPPGAAPQGPPPQGPPPGAGGIPTEGVSAMEQSMVAQDPEVFDTAAIASLAKADNFDSTVMDFLPEFHNTLDSIGRLLLDMRIKRADYLEDLGDRIYNKKIELLEDLFQKLGLLVIGLEQITSAPSNAA